MSTFRIGRTINCGHWLSGFHGCSWSSGSFVKSLVSSDIPNERIHKVTIHRRICQLPCTSRHPYTGDNPPSKRRHSVMAAGLCR